MQGKRGGWILSGCSANFSLQSQPSLHPLYNEDFVPIMFSLTSPGLSPGLSSKNMFFCALLSRCGEKGFGARPQLESRSGFEKQCGIG